MKLYIICQLLFLLLSIQPIYSAQISGISNSKIVVPATETVPIGVFEFEPAFDIFSSTQEWNINGDIVELNDRTRETSMGFRFTTGVKNNLEVGLSFPVEVSSLGFGLKWLFKNSGNLSYALQSGINFDTESGVRDKDIESGNIIGNGLIVTYEHNEKLSVDSDIAISFYTANLDGLPVSYSGTFDLGISYFLSEQFQTAVEWNSNWISFDNSLFNSSKSKVTLGITHQANEKTKIIFGLKYDLFGKNDSKGVTYLGAFTFLIG